MKLNHKKCSFLVILGMFLSGFLCRWNVPKGTNLYNLWLQTANASSENVETEKMLQDQENQSLQSSASSTKLSVENLDAENSLKTQLPVLKYVCKTQPVQKTPPDFPKGDTENKPQVMLMDFLTHYWRTMDSSSENSQTYDTDMQICKIINDIHQLMPHTTVSHPNNATSAKNTKAFIVNPRDRYFVGDSLIIQLDTYDFLGNRKQYGGDLFRARIYSPDLEAGSAGMVTDFHNGSYHVQFTLFWEGNVKISLLLIHSSEAVSILWRARNSAYDYVDIKAKFTSPSKTIETKCAHQLDTDEELCDYMTEKDEYPLYCIKPAQMSCNSLTQLGAFFSGHSHLSRTEKSFFNVSCTPSRLTHKLKDLVVVNRTNVTRPVMEKCKPGMKPQFPGGYFIQNIWHPVSCTMKRLTENEISSCLRGKSLRLIGDSTMIQWFVALTKKMKTLKELDLHDWGWQKSHLLVDPDRNIQIRYQKHGDPFVANAFYQILENPTIPQVIDRIGGNSNTVIIFNIAAHFKPFPLHIFLRRVMNIRKALQRLFLRSPATKVVVKTENIGCGREPEEMSDFHGYIQYLIMNSMLRDLNVSIVDAWEMTTAFETSYIHAPLHVIENQVNLLLTMLC